MVPCIGYALGVVGLLIQNLPCNKLIVEPWHWPHLVPYDSSYKVSDPLLNFVCKEMFFLLSLGQSLCRTEAEPMIFRIPFVVFTSRAEDHT